MHERKYTVVVKNRNIGVKQPGLDSDLALRL